MAAHNGAGVASTFHVNPNTGRSGKCTAQSRDKCPLKGDDGKNVPHFDTKEEANNYISEQAAKKHDAFSTVSKKNFTKSSVSAAPKVKRMSDEKFAKEIEKKEILTAPYLYSSKINKITPSLSEELYNRAMDRAKSNGQALKGRMTDVRKNKIIQNEIIRMRQEAHSRFVREEEARVKNRAKTFKFYGDAVKETFNPDRIHEENIEAVLNNLDEYEDFSYKSDFGHYYDDGSVEITSIDEDSVSKKIYNAICKEDQTYSPGDIRHHKPINTTPEPAQREAIKVVREILEEHGIFNPNNYKADVQWGYYDDIEGISAEWDGPHEKKQLVVEDLMKIYEENQKS